ncbi:MAG: hypothetical protein ACD_2C00144G0002 [uncultured bacterium (gcode 4)]|uniref:Uncharacterized protein n=1 Tax=uncultured bacterium (gcode 4) TaxID=1234023 RepID=K2G5M0_9BACT|nr:MAG: hypothetical protein ACD_2C00144G0002 [uncultured bacterium (gcode 4)]
MFVYISILAAEIVDICISREKCVSVPEREYDFFYRLLDSGFGEFHILSSYCSRIHHIESYSICSMFWYQQFRIWVIIEWLAHLLSIFCKNHSVYDNIQEWSSIKKQCSQHQKGIEPTSCLVYSLSDEFTRVFEILLICKRIMFARIRHGSWFEPAIENLWDTIHRASCFWALDLDFVYIMLMKVYLNIKFNIEILIPSFLYLSEFFIKLIKLFYWTYTELLKLVLWFPDRHSRAPISVSGDIPVSGILYPFSESSMFDIIWNPIYLFIILDHPVGNFFNFYIPSAYSSVDKRSMTSVAMRIWMIDSCHIHHNPPIFKQFYDSFIEIENVDSHIFRQSLDISSIIDMRNIS